LLHYNAIAHVNSPQDINSYSR